MGRRPCAAQSSTAARAELALATRGSVGQGDLANLTTCLRVAIEIHLDDGDPTTAARLLGYRAQVAEKVGVVPTPADAREDEAYAARARATLGDDGFEAAFAAGRALDASAGIELAVGQS